MAEHFTDEEQLENLKRWWQQNGVSTLLIVALSVGGYFGWTFWQEKQKQAAEDGSLAYQKMMDLADHDATTPIDDKQQIAITEQAMLLKKDFPDTQYARYASMMLAKLAVEDGEYDTAIQQLQAAEKGADKGLGLIVNLRLAKVEAAKGELDAAISRLKKDGDSLSHSYLETLGDVYLLQGKPQEAFDSYEKAISQVPETESQERSLLQLKLDQVESEFAAVKTQDSEVSGNNEVGPQDTPQ